jgi:hypothetical protein
MAMEGKHIRRIKISINGKIRERVKLFKYLACNVATQKNGSGIK